MAKAEPASEIYVFNKNKTVEREKYVCVTLVKHHCPIVLGLIFVLWFQIMQLLGYGVG
jgi:cell division septal protein FtsQ